MKSIFNQNQALEVLAHDIKSLCKKSDTHSIILLGCDHNYWPIKELNALLKDVSKPIIGGIFPQIIYDKKNHEKGYILIAIEHEIKPYVIPGLSDDKVDLEDIISETIPDNDDCQSMLVFVDGLSSRISAFLDGVFAVYGADIHYAGGGAGSLSFKVRPCVLTNQGVFQESAIIATLSKPSKINVGHGWKALDKGFVATSIDKNIIKEIDYKNAFDVYKSILAPHLHGKTISPSNFFEIAQSFPIGIKKIGGEYIVRDPIAVNDEGHLVCVGELSEGDHIDILQGRKNALITAAHETAKTLASPTAPKNGVLLIDCISRALFLKNEFHEEIEAVERAFQDDTKLYGALVLGEIANSGSGYLEFYNKTTVVALI